MTTMQELQITREYDAPPSVVWEALTNPDHVARWFGPEGFETPRETVAIELRVGGRFELDMVRDGAHHPVRYEIAELEPPRLLVLTHEPLPDVGLHQGTVTRIELEDRDGRTQLTLTDGPYQEPRYAEAGWHGAFAKLEELLRSL